VLQENVSPTKPFVAGFLSFFLNMIVAALLSILVLLAPFSQGSRTIENLDQVRGKLILHIKLQELVLNLTLIRDRATKLHCAQRQRNEV